MNAVLHEGMNETFVAVVENSSMPVFWTIAFTMTGAVGVLFFAMRFLDKLEKRGARLVVLKASTVLVLGCALAFAAAWGAGNLIRHTTSVTVTADVSLMDGKHQPGEGTVHVKSGALEQGAHLIGDRSVAGQQFWVVRWDSGWSSEHYAVMNSGQDALEALKRVYREAKSNASAPWEERFDASEKAGQHGRTDWMRIQD